MNRILLFALCILTAGILTAQHDHSQCGMTSEDQQALVDFVEYYNKISKEASYSPRTEKLNVPIRFNSVAQSDGTGRIQPTLVIQHFERLRKEFEAVDMNLYLYENRIKDIDNSSIYLNPGSASSAVRQAKDPNALNLFITENANTSSGLGTVLGFYSPTNDYIIIRITDVAGNTSSLTHELGHMFSLPHTFRGWDATPWDESVHGNPVTQTTSPGGAQVELQNMSNCASAGDRICDTPPDYNFGFGASGCNWNQQVFDRNGDLIEPMIDNFMGYFIGCNSYRWTQGQIDIMRANWELNSFNGNDRSFLRSNYEPTTDTVDHDFTLVEPGQLETSQFSDYVLLDWEDVPGAQSYQLEIRANSITTGEQRFLIFPVTDESFFELTEANLEASDLVNWTVKPYNEAYGGAPARTFDFFAGAGLSSTADLNEDISLLSISPNPGVAGNALNISFDANTAASASISLYDLAGRVIHSDQVSIIAGKNFLQLQTIDATAGIYFVKIESELGSIYKKVVLN